MKPGPLDTFPGWQRKGRSVKRGEKAITLCMPITCKRRAEDSEDRDDARVITAFVYKPRWFVLDQTEGKEIELLALPEWKVKLALAELDIEMIPFEHMDGNCQGYARKRQIAINPVAQLPQKTLFHELGHCVLGHTEEADFTDTEGTPKSQRESRRLADSIGRACDLTINRADDNARGSGCIVGGRVGCACPGFREVRINGAGGFAEKMIGCCE